MRSLLGWGLKLGVMGGIYFAMTSGVKIKLPEEILGYKVPASAQAFVDRNAQIGELGQKTTAGFSNIANSFK
ncbi:MAG: hypothetical protein ACHQK9_25170 [Reyranellales bacterium]